MQLFSPLAAASPFLAQAPPAAPGGAPDLLHQWQDMLAQMQAQIAQHSGQILLLFALAPVIQILGYWLASLPLAGEQGRLINALKVWILYLVLAIGVGIVTGIGIVALAAAHLIPAILLLVAVVALLVIVVIFAVPMKVYEIGFFRALGFLILAFLITGIGQAVAEVTLGSPTRPIVETAQKFAALQPAISTLPPAEQQKFLASFMASFKFPNFNLHAAPAALPGEAIASDSGKPLQEREDGLKVMYDELARRQRNLTPGDETANAGYEADKARYENLLKQLRTEDAARGGKKTP